jgi:hypothetical protein
LFQPLEQLAGGEWQPLLAELAFQQGVSQQSQHVQQQYRGNALVLMEVNGLRQGLVCSPYTLPPMEHLRHFLSLYSILNGRNLG